MNPDSPSGVNALTGLQVGDQSYSFHPLAPLEEHGLCTLARLPFSIRILLENLLRHCNKGMVTKQDVTRLAAWKPQMDNPGAIPFMPGRVVLQDFTGVPALVDLAALRSAVARHGGDPEIMNPFIPADLIIDHSVQVDCFGSEDAYDCNVAMEMKRNHERYTMLHWGQESFANFRVVPPGTGIVHQVNLEYLASVVHTDDKQDGQILAYPDTVLGTDSHTTMINGLGVLGWGVGGIEAEAVLLGQPYSMQIPKVVGVELKGQLPEECMATDLVLTITEFLREKGVVGCFVEFFGSGMQALSLPDRATIANMAPEYGATMGFFPVDQETIRYLQASGRTGQQQQLVEQYCKTQQLFLEADSLQPEYSVVHTIDLAQVERSLAGPRKPQERIPLAAMGRSFLTNFPKASCALNSEPGCEDWDEEGGAAFSLSHHKKSLGNAPTKEVIELDGKHMHIRDGSVVIAAITSCTNTSNPEVMIGAGLLAKKAVALGLCVGTGVKTSMAPGSMVVKGYLKAGDLLAPLEALGFHIVGYGCTTCIGNSGPLHPAITKAIEERELKVAAVLSGNRNFEARIHPLVHANYLGSPLLVVAYALAGTVIINLEQDPLGVDKEGKPVYLRDIWPSNEEIQVVMAKTLSPDLFTTGYGGIFSGNRQWEELEGEPSRIFPWEPDSTYIREPPFFKDLAPVPAPMSDINQARILAVFGDTITTDHISPAGAIPKDSPAGEYLQDHGTALDEFNSYGSRRGNHQVMMRGTFANIRIRNQMVTREGGFTQLMPDKTEMSIYEAAMRYQENATQLVILAGKDYGTGSSRDWAAKGTLLLGVKAVIAISYERIHRSNLVGMGVLPLQFAEGVDAQTLNLVGSEQLTITNLAENLQPGATLTVMVTSEAKAAPKSFQVIVRLDNAMELEHYRHGGILHYVLRQMLEK